MKRIAALCLALMLAVSVFSASAETYTKYSDKIWGTFDTLITLIAYMRTDEEFGQALSFTREKMTHLHQVFDQYNAYEGVRNLYYLNEHAPEGPVEVEPEIIDLLLKVGEWRQTYSEKTNPAMGAVLALWHEAREDGTRLPDEEALKAASLHCDWNDVLIDEAAGTVAFADPLLRLDLGAVAKGYSAQLTADGLREMGFDSFILNAGGNVVCGGAPLDGRENWTVGVEDIDGVGIKVAVAVKNTSVVTSGDYQRFYTLDGVNYHHLIDPETLAPGRNMHAVTVICEDSGLGDFLSTALFLSSYEESQALIGQVPGARGCWTLLDGSTTATENFVKIMVPLN